MEVFIDDNGNETQVGFDGQEEAAKVETAKAELIKEEYGEAEPLILGKFTSQDALAKSYSELESEAGRLRAELAALKGAPAAPAAAATTEGSSVVEGEPPATTPPETPVALTPQAPTPEQQQKIVGSILAQAGGDAEFGKLADWAGKNLEPARIQAFNDALNKGDEQAALMNLRAIQYDRLMKNGFEPPLLGGQGANTGLKPFLSEQQVNAAMADRRYSGPSADPAYIQEVVDRIEISDGVLNGR